MNVFSGEDATTQLSTFRAIATSNLHKLVFLSDHRIFQAAVDHVAKAT
jgi:hypothetical protein